jgi:hypothetical protein
MTSGIPGRVGLNKTDPRSCPSLILRGPFTRNARVKKV